MFSFFLLNTLIKPRHIHYLDHVEDAYHRHGKVTNVNIQNQTFTVQWDHQLHRQNYRGIPYNCKRDHGIRRISSLHDQQKQGVRDNIKKAREVVMQGAQKAEQECLDEYTKSLRLYFSDEKEEWLLEAARRIYHNDKTVTDFFNFITSKKEALPYRNATDSTNAELTHLLNEFCDTNNNNAAKCSSQNNTDTLRLYFVNETDDVLVAAVQQLNTLNKSVEDLVNTPGKSLAERLHKLSSSTRSFSCGAVSSNTEISSQKINQFSSKIRNIGCDPNVIDIPKILTECNDVERAAVLYLETSNKNKWHKSTNTVATQNMAANLPTTDNSNNNNPSSSSEVFEIPTTPTMKPSQQDIDMFHAFTCTTADKIDATKVFAMVKDNNVQAAISLFLESPHADKWKVSQSSSAATDTSLVQEQGAPLCRTYI